MTTRLVLLLSILVLSFCACSDDESPMAPASTPTTDRYVNAATGDDAANGSSGAPWATITHAVATADSEITIHVAPGTYDAASGETFPIALKSGQQLVGELPYKGLGGPSGVQTRIQGEGAFVHDQMTGTTIVGAEGARVAGFAIVSATDPNFHSGIAVLDSVTMEIDHNTFLNASYAGVASIGGAAPDIHDNHIQAHAYGLFLDGSNAVHVHDNIIEMALFGIRYFNAIDILVEDNSINASNAGVQLGAGTSIIQNNRFERGGGYSIGAIACIGPTHVIRGNWFRSGPALTVTFAGTPDAGTQASPGLNDFSNITGVIVHHQGTQLVTVIGNTWPTYPPQLGTDILIEGTGSVVWE